MVETLKKHDYAIMLGNVFPYDSIVTSPRVNAWYIKAKVDCGSIVILHDREWTPLFYICCWGKSAYSAS